MYILVPVSISSIFDDVSVEKNEERGETFNHDDDDAVARAAAVGAAAGAPVRPRRDVATRERRRAEKVAMLVDAKLHGRGFQEK
mmetsp:Transcript_30366/g.50457  ORF Transcript_30366/g.50457 Transcript_30366/m.50457 type:complete len:84 (+) Transcript_30366:679-930(+)